MVHLLVAGKLHPSGEALLDTLPDSGVTVDYVQEVTEACYAPLIHKADGLVIRTQPLSAATIAMAERLKVVSRHGVGYDAVDLPALNDRGIALTIVGDVNSVSVAEHAMMLLLACAKRARLADRAVREAGQWHWRDRYEQREISGKNLLILGYGRIGQALARMASGFGMQVRAYDPFLASAGWPDGDVAQVSFNEGLAWADFRKGGDRSHEAWCDPDQHGARRCGRGEISCPGTGLRPDRRRRGRCLRSRATGG